LARGPVAMPKPERVTSPVLFPTTGRIDPIDADIHVRLTVADVWHALLHMSNGVGLITYPVGTYRLVLGYYTDRPSITDPRGGPMRSAIHHVAAWLLLAYHSPAWTDPGPARIGATTTPHPPCFFTDSLIATDAMTGADLGGGTL
jgi:hypothetical protein